MAARKPAGRPRADSKTGTDATLDPRLSGAFRRHSPAIGPLRMPITGANSADQRSYVRHPGGAGLAAALHLTDAGRPRVPDLLTPNGQHRRRSGATGGTNREIAQAARLAQRTLHDVLREDVEQHRAPGSVRHPPSSLTKLDDVVKTSALPLRSISTHSTAANSRTPLVGSSRITRTAGHRLRAIRLPGGSHTMKARSAHGTAPSCRCAGSPWWAGVGHRRSHLRCSVDRSPY